MLKRIYVSENVIDAQLHYTQSQRLLYDTKMKLLRLKQFMDMYVICLYLICNQSNSSSFFLVTLIFMIQPTYLTQDSRQQTVILSN